MQPVCLAKEGENAGMRIAKEVKEDERVDCVEHSGVGVEPPHRERMRGSEVSCIP